tara:strand:+ start:36 stop:764 length:729 start_codon:yes stop_codon:yes gene_type:complete
MGKVKVHIANFVKMGKNGYVRKSKLESGINIYKVNEDFEASDKKLMFFLKPGCPPCIELYKYLKPLIKSLEGKLVKDDEDVLIAALYHDPMNTNNNDVNGLTPLAGDLNSIIRHYPMIYLYDNHGRDYEYQGNRSKDELKNFMIKELGIIVDKNVGFNEGKKRRGKKTLTKKKNKRKTKRFKGLKKFKRATLKIKAINKFKKGIKKRKKKSKSKKRKRFQTKKIKSKAKKMMKMFLKKLRRL